MPTRDPTAARSTGDVAILDALGEYVERCFEREEPPRINHFAKLLKISRRRVGLASQRVTGMTAVRFVRAQQIERATALIASGLPLKQVGYRAGFGTRRTFFRVFRQITGSTPRAYRQNARTKLPHTQSAT